MSASSFSDGPGDDSSRFECTWRREGIGAASVEVSGDVDVATSPRLQKVLHEALEHARLVLLNLRGVSFMDSAGLHVMLNVARDARQTGARLVMVGVSRQIEALLKTTGTSDQLEVLALATAAGTVGDHAVGMLRGSALQRRQSQSDADGVEHPIDPLENPVNASVLTARVMGIPERGLWFQDSGGAVRRAWAPQSTGVALSAATPIEVYLDHRGEVNGWWEPSSGLAINQRHLDSGAWPGAAPAVACQGACGLVWRAPAARKFAEHGERCLTCAGTLVLR